jgi:hypothetical protein
LLDTFEPASHCPPEETDPEPVFPNEAHDWEKCPCFVCADYRAFVKQRMEWARIESGG